MTIEEIRKEYFVLMAQDYEHDAIFLILSELQNICDARRFSEMQDLMDNIIYSEWTESALITILNVSCWYDKHLNRENLYDGVYKYFKKKHGKKYAKELVKGFEPNIKRDGLFELGKRLLLGIKD